MKAHKTPLVVLQLLAECELACNPTITEYTFDGGVEQRRAAYSLRRLNDLLQEQVDALEER